MAVPESRLGGGGALVGLFFFVLAPVSIAKDEI